MLELAYLLYCHKRHTCSNASGFFIAKRVEQAGFMVLVN